MQNLMVSLVLHGFNVLASGYLILLVNSHLIEKDVFSVSPFCGKILQNSLYKFRKQNFTQVQNDS